MPSNDASSETINWVTHWDCYTSPHWLYIVAYCVQIFAVIGITVIVTFNIHQIFCKNSETRQLDTFIRQHNVKILYIIINILYLLGIICYIGAFTSNLSCYFKGKTGVFLFYYLMIIANAFLAISAISVYLFFINRIKYLFQSKWTCFLRLFGVMFIAQILCQFVSVIFYITSTIGAWNYALSFSIAYSVLNVIFNTSLIFYFIYKIYLLIKKTEHEKDRTIITFALRHLYSAIICLISTNILGLMKIFRIIDKSNFYIIMIQNILSSFDALVTLFYLLIQFTFANSIYHKISCCCDCIVNYYTKSDDTIDIELETMEQISFIDIGNPKEYPIMINTTTGNTTTNATTNATTTSVPNYVPNLIHDRVSDLDNHNSATI